MYPVEHVSPLLTPQGHYNVEKHQYEHAHDHDQGILRDQACLQTAKEIRSSVQDPTHEVHQAVHHEFVEEAR